MTWPLNLGYLLPNNYHKKTSNLNKAGWGVHANGVIVITLGAGECSRECREF